MNKQKVAFEVYLVMSLFILIGTVGFILLVSMPEEGSEHYWGSFIISKLLAFAILFGLYKLIKFNYKNKFDK